MSSEGGVRAQPAAQHVTIVAAIVTPRAEEVAAEMRRDALHVAVGTADVMRNPAADGVYVFWFDAALGVVLAERVVQWASVGTALVGLIGVIEDGSSEEREVLLAAGFDDVVSGRLSARELSARVRAVARRLARPATGSGRLRWGSLTLDLDNRVLWGRGQTVTLTAIELAVMRELMKAQGRPLSRAQLLDLAWGEGELEISERAVDNVILRLRRKLPDPDLLETVRSVGFRLAG